ncbi:MAG TPA: leucyl aminopeptidase [bacterium]|nr:leucyl aminopeptidase [bacterium]
MRFALADTLPHATSCDLLALLVSEPGSLGAAASAVDKQLGGRLADAARADGFTGKRDCTLLLHALDSPFRRVLLVGAGRPLGPEAVRRFAAVAVRAAGPVRASRVALAVPADGTAADGDVPLEYLRAAVEGAGLAAYRFDRYRSRDDAGPDETVLLARGEHSALARVARQAEIAVAATSRARDLVNEPANVLTPSALADLARDIAARDGLGCRVIDLDDAREMGMGLFAAVAAGSAQPPKFIVLDYKPEGAAPAAGTSRAPGAGSGSLGPRTIALAGKGITFDSGGLSIKTAGGMATMKGDMAGAAAVIATMGSLRDLAVPVRVLGIAPATENMINGGATRPGDIVRGLGGKTVEINNTDAEGRLVLADAIAFAVREGVGEVIDLATLTGSCVVALGDHTGGVMSNDQPLADRLLAAAKAAGEQLWQLPLYEEFTDAMRGEISDLKNSSGREAGAERAAAFMAEFAGGTPWAHLDIAGPAFNEDRKAPPYVPLGGTGYGVRTLLRYLESAAGR